VIPLSLAPKTRADDHWRAYFEHAIRARPRFGAAPDFLRADIVTTLRRLIPTDAEVLEVGCGAGEALDALPNRVRHGIDYTPAAVSRAKELHPELHVTNEDALSFDRPDRYDAIIADRLIHGVPDIQRLLENLAHHLTRDGRIFLTCFNYLWEAAIRAGELAGLKIPTPENNWLSDSDLQNLFTIANLEVVKFEDRMILPANVPVVGKFINRYVGTLPGIRIASLYRVYVLRRRADPVARQPSVTVVVPARNEEGNVPNIIARTPVMGSNTELIFVEGGSTDNTRGAIEEAIRKYRGPLKLSLYQQTGKGKGDAVRLGFSKARGDLLMILDADLTVPPEELPKFYDVMVRGLTDYVHGTRLVYPMESEAMRFLNKLGNIGFSKMFSFLLNQPLKDTLCGTKVLWRQDYERLAANRDYFGDFDPFGDYDLIFGASKLNLKILEIPIRYRDRTYGTTNISRFRHGWMLLKMCGVAATKLKFV